MNKTFMKIANTVFFFLMVAVNILANVLPIGGFNTGQISAMVPTLITPPGWTFLIWIVICAMLAVIIGRQLLDERYSENLGIGPYFLLSCVLNIAWIFAWHTQHMVPAALAILLLLAVLWKLYVLTRERDLFTRTAFSIYYAWITVASVIMVLAMIKTLSGQAPITPIVPRGAAGEGLPEGAAPYAGLTERFTGIILESGTPVIVSYVTIFEYILSIAALVLLTAITVLHLRKTRDKAYIATVLWALLGIIVRQLTSVTPPVLFLIVCTIAACFIGFMTVKTSIDRNCQKGVLYEGN